MGINQYGKVDPLKLQLLKGYFKGLTSLKSFKTLVSYDIKGNDEWVLYCGDFVWYEDGKCESKQYDGFWSAYHEARAEKGVHDKADEGLKFTPEAQEL